MGDDLSHRMQRWLWVPAFAGTTAGVEDEGAASYRSGVTGAEISPVLSRSVMSMTVSIGAVSS